MTTTHPLWYRVWEQARRQSFFVAAHWPGTIEELAEALGCDPLTAVRFSLCRAPRPTEELEQWVQDVARYLALDPERVRAVVGRLDGR